MLIPRNTLD